MLKAVFWGFAFGAILAVSVLVWSGTIHAADCPTQGDPSKPLLAWGQKCSHATGSCAEPYRCLWPPDCRCDLNPLGMHKDAQKAGWQKGGKR